MAAEFPIQGPGLRKLFQVGRATVRGPVVCLPKEAHASVGCRATIGFSTSMYQSISSVDWVLVYFSSYVRIFVD